MSTRLVGCPTCGSVCPLVDSCRACRGEEDCPKCRDAKLIAAGKTPPRLGSYWMKKGSRRLE